MVNIKYSTWWSHCLVCSIRISEQTAGLSFYSINRLNFITDVESVYSAVRTESLYRVFNLKVERILLWVIYLLRFTTCYITQLTSIYSKCWKWCPFISMHLSTRFTMFLATFLSVLSLFNHFRNSTFDWRLPSIFQRNFVYSERKTLFLNNFPK